MAVEEIAEEFLKYSQGVAASSWVFTVNLKWRKVVIQLHWSEVSINSTGRQRLRHFTVLSACVCVACCYCFNSRKSVWPHTVEKFLGPKHFTLVTSRWGHLLACKLLLMICGRRLNKQWWSTTFQYNVSVKEGTSHRTSTYPVLLVI